MKMLTINGRGESGQDNFAFENCGRKPDGTFIDIGANEPRFMSNSYALEEVGWRGWCIDINPVYAEAHARERKSPFIAADARSIDWLELIGSTPIPIDYLSLDIDENHDRDLAVTILENLFIAGLRFRCMTIEHDKYKFGDRPRNQIRDLCFGYGYRLAYGDVEIRKGNGKPFEDWWLAC
jgi:hypothetical protein